MISEVWKSLITWASSIVKKDLGTGGIFATSLAAAGFVFTYLPSIDPSKETAKYLFPALMGLFTCSSLLVYSKLKPNKHEGSDDILEYHAFELAHQAGEGIVSNLVSIDKDRVAIGHYIDTKGDPSPLSSAYAIRAILACPTVIDSAPLRPLYQYIIDCQNDSGWQAASQSQPRPEVTADVIRALRGIDGNSDSYLCGISGLKHQLEHDSSCLEFAYVAATVLVSLPEINSVIELRSKITKIITDGFVINGKGTGYWCTTLDSGRRTASPSAAATARCLLALKACSDLKENKSIQSMCQDAMHWLASLEQYPNETEQVVRSLSAGNTEVLVPRHFTSALVVLAASAWSEFDGSEEVGNRAMDAVTKQNTDGYWRWEDGKSPVWMNSQGIEAANAYIRALSKWKRKS